MSLALLNLLCRGRINAGGCCAELKRPLFPNLAHLRRTFGLCSKVHAVHNGLPQNADTDMWWKKCIRVYCTHRREMPGVRLKT